MSNLELHKLPAIASGLLVCLWLAGCVQPPVASSLPLNAANGLLDLVTHEDATLEQPGAHLLRHPEHQLRSRATVAQLSDLELPDALPPEPATLFDVLPPEPLSEVTPPSESPPETKWIDDEPTLENDAIQTLKDEMIERGRTAFNDSCTQCHKAAQALTEKKTYDEWIETVNEMSEMDDANIKDGHIIPIATFLASRTDEAIEAAQAEAKADADADADEAKADADPAEPDKSRSDKSVAPKASDRDTDQEPADAKESEQDFSEEIEFGEVAFNASCIECHDANRSLAVKKSYSKWMSTIRRMAKKDDADINSRDFSPIARYLASRTEQEIKAANQGDLENDESKTDEDVDNETDEDTDEADEASPSSVDKRLLIDQGKTAFYNSCVECHDAERSLSVQQSFSEWMTTIRRMAKKEDANIKASSFRSIATFLSERTTDDIETSKDDAEAKADEEEKDEEESADSGRKFDPQLVASGRAAFYKSCVKCHDAERSLGKKKSLASWRATVKRMAAKDGADVRPNDVEPISVFLAAESAGGDGPADDGGGEVSPWTFSSTISTLNRVSSDPIENPGFFVDAWVGADWQSDGPLRATVMACTSCHSDRNSSKGFTFELVEASATLDLKKLLFNKYHSTETKNAAKQAGMTTGSHGNMLQLNAPQNVGGSSTASASADSPISTSADLKMGRFIVPFGAYAAFSHPGSYRTLTNPLMFNMGRRLDTGGPFQPVLPGPYSDEGLNLRLALREYCDRSYTLDLFAVNGLQGTASGTNFNLSRSYTDNNRRPAVGGRYTLGNQIFRLGASAMLGQLQNEGSSELDYHLIGADALVNTERFRAYFEYAFRREQAGALNNNEIDGYVIELEWKVRERLGFLTRYDTLEHDVASAGEQSIDRLTWGLNLALQQAGLLVLNHEHWMLNDRSDVDVVGLRWITTF